MISKLSFFIVIILQMQLQAQQQPPQPGPWVPDQGDGTYRNPIIFADYSDPDVIRVGDDFWLTASSFHCTPGLPILHSKDLVNWTIVNYALKNVPGEQYNQVQPNCGVWAPAIRFHDGKYWIFFPTPDEGIYVITAKDPKGQWSDPILMAPGKGLIDPCPLWDDDGKAYLVHAYANSRAGIKNRVRVCPMSPDGTKLLGEGKVVFHEPEKHPTLEGPKFLKKDGWYYISAPAGGVVGGWQVILRSKDVYGPYEDKIVLRQGNTPINGPHQGALIDLKNGDWWFIHFQELQPYGRITHLQPVSWKDGWPIIGVDDDGDGCGEPVLRYRKPDVGLAKSEPIAVPQTTDEFDGTTLGLQWEWHANHKDDWCSLTDRKGWLRLKSQYAPAENLKSANLLLQKYPAESFAVETKFDVSGLKFGELAGLSVMGTKYAVLAIRKTDAGLQLVTYKGETKAGTKEVVAVAWPTDSVVLRLQFASGGDCTFALSSDGTQFKPLDFPFKADHDGWIGGKVGIFSTTTNKSDASSGHADFDYFRVTPPNR